MKSRAFTLVELLVVVAIVAILSAIALPNFLEAQTRAKVSRAKSDMRTMATALATYYGDHNAFPTSNFTPRFRRFRPLTTPVAYLSSVPTDPFNPPDVNAGPFRSRGDYRYGAMPFSNPWRYILVSDGPSLTADSDPIQFYPGYSLGLFFGTVDGHDYTIYDPTNGTISRGDIFRASDFVGL